MALNYTELFEDLGQDILATNVALTSRAAVDTANQVAVTLFGEATAKQIPEHDELIQNHITQFTAYRRNIAAWITNLFTEARDKILRKTMRRNMLANGTAAILGTDSKSTLNGLDDNMLIDGETIDANVVAATAPVYTDPGNGGDWGAGSWSASVAIDTTGDHAQMIRPATCVLVCTSAGYAVQGAEEFELRMSLTDLDEEATSPVRMVAGDHVTGTETEDIELDSQGQQVPATGSSVHSGAKFTIKGPDYNDIAEAGDTGGGMSGYDVQRADPLKGAFTVDSTTFVYAVGARNGKVYLDVDWDTTDYTCTLYKDVGKNIALSDPLVILSGGGAADAKDLLLTGSAVSRFDGLIAGDVLMRFLWDAPTMETTPATQTVILDLPLPIRVGDVASFSFTSDEGGTIQTYMVRNFRKHLPSATGGSETIPDTLAE